jgi:hypothetical protein
VSICRDGTQTSFSDDHIALIVRVDNIKDAGKGLRTCVRGLILRRLTSIRGCDTASYEGIRVLGFSTFRLGLLALWYKKKLNIY